MQRERAALVELGKKMGWTEVSRVRVVSEGAPSGRGRPGRDENGQTLH